MTGSVLFEGDFSCIADAVSAAVKAKSNLSSANLSSADLRYANLSYANLRSADLSSADLRYANLSSASLRSADLRSANLSSADLKDAKDAALVIARTRILPEGNIIGWKKCKEGKIVRLLIPTDAKRSHAFDRKCRAEFVRVLEVWDGDKPAAEAISAYDNKTTYRPNEIVRCDKWDDDFTNECAGGIHFFISRIEAENH